MRYLYVALLALLPRLMLAQDVAVADSLLQDSAASSIVADERWVQSQVDSTGECTEVLHWAGAGGLVRVYHPSGRLKEYVPYANLAARLVHGVSTSWYDNNQLAIRQSFIQGQREGELLMYYPDGQLKRQTKYVAGSELPGDCFAPSGARLAYFPYEQPPLYPGGQLQLIKEISKQVRQWRPTDLVLAKAQLHISFRIKEDGSVENPLVVISDEQLILLRLPRSEAQHPLEYARNGDLKALVNKIQHGLTYLAKPFYPGQRDGAVVTWYYSMTLPFGGAVR